MTDSASFTTGVRDVAGTWPDLPELWSYSSLRDAEECPRRWALGRATYPAIWEGRGYPPRPIMPAIVGQIIHGSLDLVLRALYERGCASISDQAATQALRDLGGYSALIEREIDNQLGGLQSNPRMAERALSIRTSLRSRLPDIRQRVQTMVARATLAPTQPIARIRHIDRRERIPLRQGSHPEVTLRVPALRLAGRADLLTVTNSACAIVDYKTGAPNEHHAEQVRMYQLLWSRDTERNPDRVPVESLTLLYAANEMPVAPLAPADLEALADDLAARVRVVERDVIRRPPPARPAPAMCPLCSVRHLCDEYWSSPAVSDDEREFVDRQGTVVARNGPKSWLLDVQHPAAERILLRTPTEQPRFDVGETVRLLDLVLTREDDEGASTITMTPSSETFSLRGS